MKIMFGVEINRQNINIHVVSFWRNNDHFDFAFLCFGALNILTASYFVLIIHLITFFKKKLDVLFISVFFPALFP